MTRITEHYRNLAAAFLETGLDPSARETRGRVLADAGVDLARGMQIASAVLPSRMTARLNGEGAFIAALEQHAQFDALRDLADVPGLNGRYLETGLGGTGLGGGLPLIRGVATSGSRDSGITPVIPELTAGTDAGVVDPDLPLATGTGWTIADVGANRKWHFSTIVATLAMQLVKEAKRDERVGQMIDQIMFDVADRGAELWIGDALRDLAGGTRDSDGDTNSALDEAESAANDALDAPADMLLVNPVDWPAVRRSIAFSYQQAPAPAPLISMGVPLGTVLVTGRAAFHLLSLDYEIDGAADPRHLTSVTGVHRPFYLAVRKPAAIQAVVLTEA